MVTTPLWDDTPPDDCDAPESHPDGCACVRPGEEPEPPGALGHPDLIDAILRRASRGGRWRSPEGAERRAIRVESGAAPVHVGGRIVGVMPRARGDDLIVWDDETTTRVFEVAHPRLGWKAILEVGNR